MIQQLLQRGPFRIRRLPGQHVVHRAAERINIAADVGIAGIPGLLGRDIVECPQGRAGHRDVADGIRRVAPCEPKVDDLHSPGVCQHDI